MRSAWPLLLLLAASACGSAAKPTAPAPPPSEEADDERSPAVPGGEALEAHLRGRLPGVANLRLVKLLRWSERTPGACTADFSAEAGGGRVDLDFQTDTEKRSLRDADVSSLGANGWDPAYRTPNGVGFEKVASFRSIDLTLRQTLECRCFGGDRPVTTYPTVLRLRWRESAMPEESAAIERDGVSQGLRPAVTVGRLVTYDFPISASFPDGHAGSCDAHLAITLLVEPPIR